MVMPLYQIEPGERAVVEWMDDEHEMALRLKELGFVSGERLTCVLKRRSGEIAAYLVRNAVIALRREDARAVLVREERAEVRTVRSREDVPREAVQ